MGGGKDTWTTGEVIIEIDERIGVANEKLQEIIELLTPLPPPPPIYVRHLPYFAELNLVDGDKHTEDLKDDEEQGLGVPARSGIVENLSIVGMTGTLLLEIFDGDDWCKQIPLAIGQKFVFEYHDAIYVQHAKITASGGPITYKLFMAPGEPAPEEP